MTICGLVDLHLHTCTSSDAEATVEEHCRRAAELGLREIAITNHMNVRTAKYHVTPRQLCSVRDEIAALETALPNIALRLGVEVDYFPDMEDEIAAELQAEEAALGHPLDIVLVGLHVLRGVRFASKKQAPGLFEATDDVATLYREYLRLLARAVRTGLYDVIAHPDLIKRFTHLLAPPVAFGEYREACLELVEAAIETETAIELNVKGREHPVGEFYPSVEFLELYVAECAGARVEPLVTLGSDAHAADGLGLHLAEGACALRRLGLSRVMTFERRRPVPFELPMSNDWKGAS